MVELALKDIHILGAQRLGVQCDFNKIPPL